LRCFARGLFERLFEQLGSGQLALHPGALFCAELAAPASGPAAAGMGLARYARIPERIGPWALAHWIVAVRGA
jgi:hypothetical protein